VNSLALWLQACTAGLDLLTAIYAPPHHPPATVTDIREGHVIRARRARQRERRP
jgi:hypothetical protein